MRMALECRAPSSRPLSYLCRLLLDCECIAALLVASATAEFLMVIMMNIVHSKMANISAVPSIWSVAMACKVHDAESLRIVNL